MDVTCGVMEVLAKVLGSLPPPTQGASSPSSSSSMSASEPYSSSLPQGGAPEGSELHGHHDDPSTPSVRRRHDDWGDGGGADRRGNRGATVRCKRAGGRGPDDSDGHDGAWPEAIPRRILELEDGMSALGGYTYTHGRYRWFCNSYWARYFVNQEQADRLLQGRDAIHPWYIMARWANDGEG